VADETKPKTEGRKVYTVTVLKPAEKAIGRLGAKEQKQVRAAIDDLQNEPRPVGYIKLKGDHNPPQYRMRTGDYRIVYNIDDAIVTVTVINAGHRKDIYE
jgi:mRNA interferase RelE/StbE